MSTFTEHKASSDRSASDRRRHKEKIEKAIRDGIHNIVADESIIGQDGKKKIKIPVKGIKEYRFVYGENENNKKVGSAPDKDIKRGQKIGESTKKKGAKPGEPGNEAGNEYYDIEISLDELAEYLFKELNLPDLERKALKKIMSEKIRRKGYRKEGIRPRLDKKKSAIERIKRKKATKRTGKSEEELFPFHENDLIYRHFKKTKKECASAVIFFVMDISGSMTQEKKFLARSFFFLLYHFIRSKYENTEVVFISHDTKAYEVNEEQFFSRGNSGGTLVSTALDMVCDVVEKRFHPNSWNVYTFQCSDGDNWPDDTPNVLSAVEKIKRFSQLFGYCEIAPTDNGTWFAEAKLSKVYESLTDKKLKMAEVKTKDDIWPAFKKFFGGKNKRRVVSSG